MSGCWNHQGTIGPNGYGLLTRVGKQHYAHRYVWTLMRGSIPEDMQVCHACDNRACIRPSHLFLGTNQDNMDDMRRKGRAANPPLLYGERHHNAKLNAPLVRAIRADSRILREVAAAYGVSIPTIHRIRRGIGWRHVR